MAPPSCIMCSQGHDWLRHPGWVMLGCWPEAPTPLRAVLLLSLMLPCEVACEPAALQTVWLAHFQALHDVQGLSSGWEWEVWLLWPLHCCGVEGELYCSCGINRFV